MKVREILFSEADSPPRDDDSYLILILYSTLN